MAFGKIFTTAFSIGSGGSGGVFGPSVVIGGAVGGAVGMAFHSLMPSVVDAPGAFVVVGMAGFFTAVSNTPISTIIFVSEMTDSYHLLLPSLLVCSVCYLLSRRFTIFRNQVRRPLDSPAHAGEFFLDLLARHTVADLMARVRPVEMIPEEMPFEAFKELFTRTNRHYFPVRDRFGRLSGIFSSTDIRSVLFSPEIGKLVVMRDIATPQVIVTRPSEDLNAVMRKFTARNIDSLPVTAEQDSGELIGMLDRRDVIAFYNQRIEELKKGEGIAARPETQGAEEH